MSDIFVATDTFQTVIDGKRVIVRRGVTRVRKGHELLKGREHLFEPIGVHYDVEQATQAPGEKRVYRKKTAVRKTAASDDER
jgi:hypothetical protein